MALFIQRYGRVYDIISLYLGDIKRDIPLVFNKGRTTSPVSRSTVNLMNALLKMSESDIKKTLMCDMIHIYNFTDVDVDLLIQYRPTHIRRSYSADIIKRLRSTIGKLNPPYFDSNDTKKSE
jgi:hypothetical protein